MFLLDTYACIRILNGSSSNVVDQFRTCDPADISLCSVVKAELFFGARNSSRVEENLLLLHRFFELFVCYSFDDVCAAQYGITRSVLKRSGQLIGPNDMMIAAIAQANDLTLVTHNTGEFSQARFLNAICAASQCRS